MHTKIIKYKDKEFQIIDDKYILIGNKKFKIPKPRKTEYGRKKWKIEIQVGINPQTGKRIRKYAYFENYEEAIENAAIWVIEREMSYLEGLKIFKEEILPKIKFKAPEEIKEEKKEKIPKIVKHGKKWSFRIKKEGKTLRFSFDTYEEALKKAYEIKGIEFSEKKNNPLLSEDTLGYWMEKYLEWFKNKKKNEESYKYERKVFNRIIQQLGKNFKIEDITPEVLHKYREERLQQKIKMGKLEDIGKKNVSNQTVNHEIMLLHRFFEYLIANGYYKDLNPVAVFLKKYKKLPVKNRDRVLSPEERENLFKGLNELPNDNYSKQRKMIILLLYFTGARLKEVLNLKRTDIIPFQFAIIFKETKTKKERKIRLIEDLDFPPEIAKIFMDLLLTLPIDEENPNLLFPNFKTGYALKSLRKWWNNFCKKINLKDFYLHDFRHDFITRMATYKPLYIIQKLTDISISTLNKFKIYEAGNTTTQLQQITGHNSFRAFNLYFHPKRILKHEM